MSFSLLIRFSGGFFFTLRIKSNILTEASVTLILPLSAICLISYTSGLSVTSTYWACLPSGPLHVQWLLRGYPSLCSLQSWLLLRLLGLGFNIISSERSDLITISRFFLFLPSFHPVTSFHGSNHKHILISLFTYLLSLIPLSHQYRVHCEGWHHVIYGALYIQCLFSCLADRSFD